jgi:hypothetical protein
MYQLITTTGKATELSAPVSLEDLQKAVGGYIQIVRFHYPEGKTGLAYVNEEGYLLNLPINHAASVVLGMPIVGDVVFVTGEEEGND